jgi:phage terminase large subunit-like protein
MRSPQHQQEFTLAAMRFISDVETFSLTHDGHAVLTQHVRNARRAPNKFGVSLQKEHRESARKIDLAVCAVGARMVWRLLLNKDAGEKARGGRVW